LEGVELKESNGGGKEGMNLNVVGRKEKKRKVCPWDLKAWGGKLRGDSSKAREGTVVGGRQHGQKAAGLRTGTVGTVTKWKKHSSELG
jgi:hypothetical protein